VTRDRGKQKRGAFVEIAPRECDRLYDLVDEFPRGVYVTLTDGEYRLSKTVVLPSNTTIKGAGRERTRIVLENRSNCHLFTNSAHAKGNKNLSFAGFSVEGRGAEQDLAVTEKPTTTCCGIYLRRVAGVQIDGCSFHEISQTAAHFSECRNVVVKEFRARNLGWSGVSTINTSDLWIEAIVEDAGGEQSRPAIHVDGGIGVYVDATVTRVTGNGIMLDSGHADLSKCVIKGSASHCLSGISVRGTPENDLTEVYIEGVFDSNKELGILISNSHNVVVARSLVQGNGVAGIRFQGRNGGRNCLVVDTIVADNPVAFQNLHASDSNWIFDLPGTGDGSADEIRKRTLTLRQSTIAQKRQRTLAQDISKRPAVHDSSGSSEIPAQTGK
jgi:hypothetical protein